MLKRLLTQSGSPRDLMETKARATTKTQNGAGIIPAPLSTSIVTQDV